MSVMIKLKLPSPQLNFGEISHLPGLADLTLDASYGLIAIDPRQSLYVVRAESIDQIKERRMKSPEIIDAYGDIRISTNDEVPL